MTAPLAIESYACLAVLRQGRIRLTTYDPTGDLRWQRRGGHYVIMSFAARWAGKEPVLNDEHDDFKWLAPDGLGDLQVTGGLQEVIDAAVRLIRP